MKDTLETSEVLFYAQANGDILRMDGGQVSPESFWASLPEATRLALAKAAPKYAGPWLKSGDGWVRDCVGLTAGYVYPSPDGEWVADEIDDREFATAEEAMSAEDAALRAKGWCLDG